MSRPMRVGIAMLATSGGSSVAAMNIGALLREAGVTVTTLHGSAPTGLPEGAAALSTEPSHRLRRALDIDRAFCGAMDLCSQVIRWYEANPFDVLHLHNLQVFGLPALLLKRIHGVPYVVTCHGSDVLNDMLMASNAAVAGEVLAEAAGVSCVSHYLAGALVRVQPQVRPRVIFNFLDDRFRRPAPPVAKERVRILHVSSLRGVKQPELMLASFAAFHGRHAGATLRVATTHPGVTRSAELIRAYDPVGALASAVTIVNTDHRPERLHDEYRRASTLLLTSRYESFGLVILEALAYGNVVVAPAVGGIPEVVGTDWPFLVDAAAQPEDYAAALARATRTGMWDRVEDAAQAILSRFAPGPAIDSYIELYRSAA